MWGYFETNRKPATVTTTMICLGLTFVISLGLAFADLNSLKPLVSNVSVAGAAALLIPSTARSATTGYARFLKLAAF